jgi:hypothetical protein
MLQLTSCSAEYFSSFQAVEPGRVLQPTHTTKQSHTQRTHTVKQCQEREEGEGGGWTTMAHQKEGPLKGYVQRPLAPCPLPSFIRNR